MRADTYNGNTVLTLKPCEDPEFERLIKRAKELNAELDKILSELFFYSQEFSMSCVITPINKENKE